MDRANRIGQRKLVHLHKFLLQGATVEQSVLDLQERKRLIVDSVYNFTKAVPPIVGKKNKTHVDIDYVIGGMTKELGQDSSPVTYDDDSDE